MIWLQFFFLAGAWGASFLFMRQAVPAFGPLPLIAVRVGSASLLLLPWAWPHRAKLLARWPQVLLLGLVNNALPFSLLAWALRELAAGHGSILNAMTPLFVASLGQLFFSQRQPPAVWLGLILGLLGIVLTLEPWRHQGALPWMPTFAGLLATASYGYGVHYFRRFQDLPALAGAFANTSGALVWLLIPSLLTWPAHAVPAAAWASALSLGVVCTALAWSVFIHLYKAWGPLRTSLVTYLIPFFGILWGWLFLNELPQGGWWLGLAFVLGGLWLAQRRPRAIK
jgi:drug/metabolite transporter (DMT)-like permease